jgi:hypothetical protein
LVSDLLECAGIRVVGHKAVAKVEPTGHCLGRKVKIHVVARAGAKAGTVSFAARDGHTRVRQ